MLHRLDAYRQLLAVEVAGVELRVWLLHVAAYCALPSVQSDDCCTKE